MIEAVFGAVLLINALPREILATADYEADYLLETYVSLLNVVKIN